MLSSVHTQLSNFYFIFITLMAVTMELFNVEIKLTNELILTAERAVISLSSPPPACAPEPVSTPEATPPPAYSPADSPRAYSPEDRPALAPVQPAAPSRRRELVAAIRERIRLRDLEENWD